MNRNGTAQPTQPAEHTEEGRHPVTVREFITPALAREYLTRNVHNRPVRIAKVHRLAAAILRGEWQETHQGIAFDTNDDLADGQHRLFAVVRADIGVWMPVTRGMAPEAFTVIDQTDKRTGADVLRLMGEVDAGPLSAALGWKVRFDTGFMANKGVQLTPDETIAVLEEHPGIRECIAPAKKMSPYRMMSVGLAAWVRYELTVADPDAAHTFFERLTTSGLALRDDEPVKIARDRLVENATRPSKLPQYMIAAFVIKAWNAQRAGRKIHLLRLAPGEDYPAVAGGGRSRRQKASPQAAQKREGVPQIAPMPSGTPSATRWAALSA
jgi:hypothetical protein